MDNGKTLRPFGMSDNIVVLFECMITGTLSGDGATQDEIMRYAENGG